MSELDCVHCGHALLSGRCYLCNPPNTVRGDPGYVAALEAKREAGENALRQIAQWSDAYPLSVFPEPDFQRASALLMAGGMTLDSISASNVRHVVEGVGMIAKEALAAAEEKT